jgi:hypothetical protein
MNIFIKNKYDHLFMKEDQLFVCNVPHVSDLPNHNASSCAFGIVGKPLMSKGARSWFHNVLSYGEKLIEY